MEKSIIDRVISVANYIINTKKTIRETAKIYNVSKSTIHKDIKYRLYELDKEKYQSVQKIMKEHINIRHIRGGESTRKKYKKVTEE